MDLTAQVFTTSALLQAMDAGIAGIDASIVDMTIKGVSQRMTRRIGGRVISPVKVGITERQILVGGVDSIIFCQEYPVANLTVTLNDLLLVLTDDYLVETDSGTIIRVSGSDPITWEAGTVVLSYDAGYATVPPDLQQLASLQCVFELMKTQKGLVGIRQRDPTAGTTFTLEADGLLTTVAQGLRNWERRSYSDGVFNA